ncbi:MAG: gamma-glutamylcyclotransferase family protein, partial [Shimia sp.]
MKGVFGYGSLVNRATLPGWEAAPASLTGWRRIWCHTPLRPVAFLSIHRVEGATIHGLRARVPDADWPALDAREAAYDRIPIDPMTVTFAVPPGDYDAPTTNHPILRSYLDTVAQGFLQEYGDDGLRHFIATTDGWDAPILDDRASPRYPRATALTEEQSATVDHALFSLC